MLKSSLPFDLTEREQIMTASLTHEAFAKNLNTIFRIRRENQPDIELELTQVSEHLISEHQERFAIIFRGPNEVFLGQGMQNLEHNDLQIVDLFLVPVGRDDAGTYYEAVFNRLRQKSQGEPKA